MKQTKDHTESIKHNSTDRPTKSTKPKVTITNKTTPSGRAWAEFVNEQMQSTPEDWEELERVLKEQRESDR